jgi:hypothetical protein
MREAYGAPPAPGRARPQIELEDVVGRDAAAKQEALALAAAGLPQ